MIRKAGWLLAVAGMAAAGQALAVEVERSVEVAASPDKVWHVVGDFCGIASWHPAVDKCSLSNVGGVETRTLSLVGGGTIIEKSLGRDDANWSYRYAIEESPLPVANYSSTIAVLPRGDGAILKWSGTFEAKGASDADASKVIAGIYEAGLKSIADKAK